MLKTLSGTGLSLLTVIAVAAVFATDRVEAETASPLPSYKVNTGQISVSGISSGGCWDWWGYTGDNYHRKSGVQMAVVKKMIDRVTGASRAPALARAADGQTATIYEHVIEGRATRCGASDVCVAGSGKVVGS
jgi:hypothetical protein